jgi:hypothetical protein
MKKILLPIIALGLIISCSDVKEKAKSTLNKSGEAVGETATEFIEGVTEGVDRTLDSNIILSEALKKQGLNTGKFYIESDSLGKDNKLVIYLITEKDFKGKLTFKVVDKKGLETGRQSLELNRKAGEAAYHDIIFDGRTDIEVKSTIQID